MKMNLTKSFFSLKNRGRTNSGELTARRGELGSQIIGT